MSYHRNEKPLKLLKGEELTSALTGMGLCFATKALVNPKIEDTLIAASIEGIENKDFRLLSILTTWLEVHHPWVNVDRLFRALKAGNRETIYPYWAAIGNWLEKDRRFLRVAKLYKGKPIDFLTTGTDFQISRHGEDPRFAGSCLRVPLGVLRDRKKDVLTPSALAKIHSTYRQRVHQGPCYRADMWSELMCNPLLSATKLARNTYGSFATAWRVKKDWALLN